MRHGILLAVALLLSTVPALAANEQPTVSPTVTAGGLACFTVTPAEVPPAQTTRTTNCDELCAAHDAACTGVAVGAMNPPPGCSDRYVTPSMANCRCCQVAK